VEYFLGGAAFFIGGILLFGLGGGAIYYFDWQMEHFLIGGAIGLFLRIVAYRYFKKEKEKAEREASYRAGVMHARADEMRRRAKEECVSSSSPIR